MILSSDSIEFALHTMAAMQARAPVARNAVATRHIPASSAGASVAIRDESEPSVSTSTICKWRKRPWFAAALSDARKTGIENVIERLDMLANKAITLLITVVEDGEIDPKARVKAAAEILDRVGISGAEGMRRRIEQRAFETVYLVLEQARTVLPPDLFAAVYAAIIDAPETISDADKAQLSEAVQKRVTLLAGKASDLSPEELDAVGKRYIDKARQAREALASANAGKNAQATPPTTEGAEKG